MDIVEQARWAHWEQQSDDPRQTARLQALVDLSATLKARAGRPEVGRGRFLIQIDQATRDALGQLLIGMYLRRAGQRVAFCNQMTLQAMCERFRPDVLFASWLGGGATDTLLRRVRNRARIVLVDQEGRRAGETSFKRALRRNNGAQIRSAGLVDKLVAWERNQARWIAEEGVPEERIEVTGSPRLDAYLASDDATVQRKFLGLTFRADPITSDPLSMLRNIYGYRDVDPSEGIRPALPVGAQYEDWMWEVMATTRVMFRAIGEVRKRSQVSMLVRPGPWERHGSYDFLVEEIGNLRVVPFMLQHEYLRNCFATIDCYSTLGIESLLAGTPVISIVQLVARLEQHVGGVEGTRFDAPYRRYFWQPKDFAELVELVQRAERGELPVSPDPDGFRTFMRESYGWPGVRPASFETGDLLLRTLDSPRREIVATVAKSGGMRESIKLGIYRYVPGSTCVPTARVLWGYYFGVNRESMRRYHYLESFYPHHSSVRRLFAGLARRFDVR